MYERTVSWDVNMRDKNRIPEFTRDVRKAQSFRCGMDSTNNVYVSIENIHIL